MAKASVTLKCKDCGAEYTVTKKCYNRKEADSWEAYMQQGNSGQCTECWKKDQQRKREIEKAQLAEKVNAKLSEARIVLPELVGSEKQVAWANDIRNNFISILTKKGLNWTLVANKTYPESIAKDVEKLFEPSAKAWIESRGTMILNTYVE